MSFIKGVEHLKIPLEEIKLATNNFSNENFIARGGFGKVYGGMLSRSEQGTVAVKRLDRTLGQGDREFLMEIQMLSCYRHKNLISLVGFCDEGDEKILVYEHASRGSLDRYLTSANLMWMQRLKISLDAARGLNYLHNDVGLQHRVLHRDIKSSNILLNDNWEAKLSDFGLSKIGPSNLEHTFLVSNACGTFGYVDPLYMTTGILTKESDIYSFGVLLFEILCGRFASSQKNEDGRQFLAPLAQHHYEQDTLDEIIDPNLRKQMKLNSLNMFSKIAYQCLKESRKERPTMGQIIECVQSALELQRSNKFGEFGRVGLWGRKTGGPQNRWSFQLESNHNLRKITIDHGDLIYSLMFTTEDSQGTLHTSETAGGWNGGDIVSEVILDADEEMNGINGTVGVSTGTYAGYTIISSLSFETNKTTHGPFGQAKGTPFFVPWDKGLFAGFYGLAGYFIDGIGVNLKAASEGITQVGTWGAKSNGGPQHRWSFPLNGNQHLKKIIVDHGDLIYSFVFTAEYRGFLHTSDKVGGSTNGNTISEVTFDWDEEIIAISGTIEESSGYIGISSLSFLTNKKTHGTFGQARGTPFTVPWDKGLFAGFYGISDHCINGIGIYLKANM